MDIATFVCSVPVPNTQTPMTVVRIFLYLPTTNRLSHLRLLCPSPQDTDTHDCRLSILNKHGVHGPRALHDKLGLCDVIKVLQSRRFNWFGYIERAHFDSCIKIASDMRISSIKRRGRPKILGYLCASNYMKGLCIKTLTLITVYHGELQFDNAWYCQPHLM